MKLVSSLVVPALSSKWKEVGLQLDITPSRIQTIGNRYFMTKEGCGTAMFVQWLHSAPGTGNKQRSWESVLHAVKTGHSMDEEETIRKDLREIAAQTAHQEEDHTAKVNIYYALVLNSNSLRLYWSQLMLQRSGIVLL